MKSLLNYIADTLDTNIVNYQRVSGGDISTTYVIEAIHNRFFLKLNSNQAAYAMFLAESDGLQAIADTQAIATPKVYQCQAYKEGAFLLLEYIESKIPSSQDFENLGNQLAALHQATTSAFGWHQDNFIGSLPQNNQRHNNWATFYIEERLLPQLQLAQSKQLLPATSFPDKEKMYAVCNPLFKSCNPSLLHGDLWSGNFLIKTDGTPYLIDPAVYYGHGEVDIAMSQLFGGFNTTFYQSYQKHFSLSEYSGARIELYQLYYLLVHLNLFGSSYYKSVQSILSNYF